MKQPIPYPAQPRNFPVGTWVYVNGIHCQIVARTLPGISR